MTKASTTSVHALVSRIERAPNASRLIDAYDAALGGTDVSMHRYQGQWQVWHGERSGLCGDFYEVRAHLAAEAEEILDRDAEAQIASAPAMVPTPVQQQQARDLRAALRREISVTALGHQGHECDPESPEASLWIVTNGVESRDFESLEEAKVYAAFCEGLGYIPARDAQTSTVPEPVRQQACAAAAAVEKPWASQWTRISSRIIDNALLGVLKTIDGEFCDGRRVGRGLPVVRLEGDQHIMLGWAENEDAAAACGTCWQYRFDLAVRVVGEDGPLAYILLGNGQIDDVVGTFKVTITAFDGDGNAVDECDDRASQWKVGDWLFDGHNPACRFAEMCDAIGFVPALDGTPPHAAPAMIETPCQQQQACAAAPVPHPPGLPTHGWLDEELKSYVDGVLRELMPDEEATPRQGLTDVEIAETHAYAMTKAWLELYEQDCALPLSVPFGDVFDARQRLQDAHARVSALKNAACA